MVKKVFVPPVNVDSETVTSAFLQMNPSDDHLRH